MIDFIDGVLEPLLWFLADWSLRWGLLIVMLAAWLVLVRPRRSATRYLVCILVFLAGLVLPALPRWGKGFAIANTGSRIVATARAKDSALPDSVGQVSRKDPKQQQPDLAPADTDRASANDSPSPAQLEKTGEPWGLRRVTILSLAIAWLLGAGILFARRLGGWLLLKRMRRTALPVQGNSLQVLQACVARLALRRNATLAAHATACSPITLGLHRPMILVPPSWSELPEPVQRASLLHELAHLARYDDWSALALELVRSVFFFHPLVLWLLGRIECERELLCDEMVVGLGIDARDYAGVLLEFSRQAGRLRPVFVGPSYPLGFGHRRTVKARINRLLEANMNRWMSPLPARRAIALGTIALAFALGLGSIRIRGIAAADFNRSQTADDVAVSQGDRDSSQKVAQVPESTGAPSDYRIEPYHVLKIGVLGTDPTNPIVGNYLVEPAGKIDLGPAYGKVAVAGLTLEDAEAAIKNFLEKRGLGRARPSVTLAGWVTRWLGDPGMKAPYHIKPLHLLKIKVSGADPESPLAGDFLIEPSGKLNLGPAYGRVVVGGLTLEGAQEAIEKHLKPDYPKAKVSVTLAGWESDWNDLRKQSRQANQASPKPGGRNESLSYENKSFAEWRAVLTTELKPEVRIEAIRALSAFGANGYSKEAAEAILEVMRGYDIQQRHPDDTRLIDAALFAFGKIGSEGVPTLLDELKRGKGNGRRFAISVLRRDFGKAAAPAIIEAFKDEDRYIRYVALSGSVPEADPKLLVPALIQSLKDTDKELRRLAADRLAQVAQNGQNAKPAIPALVAALNDGNSGVRSTALSALKHMGAGAKDVFPALLTAIKDKSSDVRANAFQLVEALGPDAKEAVPALIAAFEDARPVERVYIANALGSIGPAAKQALPILVDFMKQPEVKGNEKAFQDAIRKISK